MKYLILACLMLSACGSGSGGSGTGIGGTPTKVVNNQHTFQAVVTTTDPVGFHYAPVLNVTNGDPSVSPGPEIVVQGVPQVYSITGEVGEVQITSISSSNPAFTLDVEVYKDNVLVQSVHNLGNAGSEDWTNL